jgi:methionyl-tRNA formyltransferase
MSLLWKPLGIRSIRRFHTASSPLSIAFFGSDEFSVVSLKALLELQKRDTSLINTIDVIAKHPKRTGRDLKQLSDVPIAQFAEAVGVPVVRAETTAEINHLISKNYSMAIAVSYGKLIPKKFIETIPYSLNVHPSLLPKYSGASPLQFALLNGDKSTGVTVQTLHPTQFDRGAIVAQKEGIEIHEGETLGSLRDRCALEGAQLLADVIENGSYKEPSLEPKYEYSYASKITPQMSEIEWSKTAQEIIRQYNTLGPLYTFKEIKVKKRRKPLVHEWRRVILSDITNSPDCLPLQPGEFTLKDGMIVIQTSMGSISAKTLQLEFEKKEDASKFFVSLPKRAGDTSNTFSQKE